MKPVGSFKSKVDREADRLRETVRGLPPRALEGVPSQRGDEISAGVMREFLDTVFGAKDEKSKMVLFYLPKAHAQFFDQPNPLIEAALKHSSKENVYIHTCTTRQTLPTRPSEKDVDCMYAVWLDADLAKEGSAKKYPESQGDILEILESFPPPTVTVDSGSGGRHCWWVLQEPIRITDVETRAKTKSLSERWQGAIIGEAQRRGYAFDSTHDLARILRLPGTPNHKYDYYHDVKIVAKSGRKYTVDELEAAIKAVGPRTVVNGPARVEVTPTGEGTGGPAMSFNLSAIRRDAPTTGDILAIQGLFREEFSDRWPEVDAILQAKEKRQYGDGSLSALDFAAGKEVRRAQGSWQQVFTAMWISRDAHLQKEPRAYESDTSKLQRNDYLEKTFAAIEQALGRELLEQSIPIDPPVVEEGDRDRVLASLTNLFGVRFTSITIVKTDPPTYTFEIALQGGEIRKIEIGGLAELCKPRVLPIAVSQASRAPVKSLKKDQWIQKYVNPILRVATEKEGAPELSLSARIVRKLEEYLRNAWEQPWASDNLDIAIQNCSVLVKDGFYHFHLDTFKQLLEISPMFRATANAVVKALLDSGCRECKLNYAINDDHGTRAKRSNKRYWKSIFRPEDFGVRTKLDS